MNKTLYTEYKAARQMGYSATSALAVVRSSLKTADLGLPRYPADCVIEKDGVMFTIKIENDTESTPFDWDCFYAEPESAGSRRRDSESGVAFITDSSGRYHAYPRAEAIAKCADMHRLTWPRCTRYQQAIEAVDAEINYWHEWLNDSRYLIGVIVTAESAEGFTADASLWGVEAGDSHGSWRDIAADLIAGCAGEIAAQQQDRIDSLDDALEADFAGIEFCGF
jgi:hypothetical protein